MTIKKISPAWLADQQRPRSQKQRMRAKMVNEGEALASERENIGKLLADRMRLPLIRKRRSMLFRESDSEQPSPGLPRDQLPE